MSVSASQFSNFTHHKVNRIFRIILLLVITAIFLLLYGCTGSIPYRTAELSASTNTCTALYEKYSDGQKLSPDDVDDPCWKRSIEEHGSYDLLFAEFDDQGWIQGTDSMSRPHPDHLDYLSDQLNRLYEQYRTRGLSLVVFVHGWHHNAKANDGNVRSFRKLLSDVALAEESGTHHRRVVGLYVGWRGESLTPSWINWMTFWERKSTAEKVAQGSVRELFSMLDVWRDQAATNSRKDPNSKRIRMLTIGHSFGGLITYESLSSDFLHGAALHNDRGGYLSRTGDLVVIVNPAFEGTRYEALKGAGQRLKKLNNDQLPIVIVATSEKDYATRYLFPFARVFSTMFEDTPGAEGKANRYTVGHNSRYTTHVLKKCEDSASQCKNTCPEPEAAAPNGMNIEKRRSMIQVELDNMLKPAKAGFSGKEYLCDDMMLTATDQLTPNKNPFWVVETTGDIMKSHNDIFNERFESFIRQMYLAVIVATDK